MDRKIKRWIILITMLFVTLGYCFSGGFLSVEDTSCGEDVSHEDGSMGNLDLSLLEAGFVEDEKQKKDVMPKGMYIHIHLDSKQLYLYKDGELLNTYPVSGGKPSTPSPLGTWKIISKSDWGEGFGGGWLGFNVPWGKYGIHGTQEPWFVGRTNASKGCIRMKNKDLLELYHRIPYGTLVKIVHEQPTFRELKSGDIGSDVLETQMRLKALGYFKGYCNGKFGEQFKQSVLKFQKDNKLSANGKINRKTLEKILLRESESKQKDSIFQSANALRQNFLRLP